MMPGEADFRYDVFLSFSNSDVEMAQRVWDTLSEQKLTVFWSDNSLKREIGESWFDKVEQSLEQSQHMVILITKTSLKSKWVMREYKAFLNSCYKENIRRLIPLLDKGIQIQQLPLFMREFQSFRVDDRTALAKMSEMLKENSLRIKKGEESEQRIKEKEKLEDSNKKDIIQKVSKQKIQENNYSVFEDPRDHTLYHTIEIGDQVWFAENLRYKTTDSRQYKNLNTFGSDYGRLYHWFDAQHACPDGWRIPNYHDWDELIIFVGGYGVAGETLIHGGFSALYGGMAMRDTFAYIKRHAYFWSSDSYDTDNAWRYALYKNEKEINKDIREKELFYSVRCIRNF